LKKRLLAPSEVELFRVLKDVSRSFYVSVRFLPKRIRLTIAISYLLARASDTIADTNSMVPRSRIEFLRQFLKQIYELSPANALGVAPFLEKQAEGPEKVLLLNIKRILLALRLVAPEHRKLVAEVLSQIIHGQTLDIERFEMQAGIQKLPDELSLVEYTYLVAGSVGEFWTNVCLLEWRHYSHLSAAKLLELGREFGQGLQLINILRDFSSDLHEGRCYLPVGNLDKVVADPNLARPEWERWRRRAVAYLGSGWEYVNAIRPPLVRFACAVPVLIGVRTLDLLGSEARLRPGVKVTRSEVKKLLCWAVALAWLPFLKGYVGRRMFRRAAGGGAPPTM
jgi:farnesyl-diphosphate farnesyltransferase